MKRLPPNQQEAIDPSTKPERLRALAKRSEALERKVAQNPNTPTDLLLELSERADRKIKEGLAKNPSTPPAILFSLARLFPEEFLQNPVLPLLFVEDPNAALRLPPEALIALLSCEGAPEYFFALAYQLTTKSATDHWVNPLQLALAQNPRTPPPILEALSLRVRERGEVIALLENPSRTPRVAAILATRESHTPSKEARRSNSLSRAYQELLSKVGLLDKPKSGEPTTEELYLLAGLGDAARRYVAAHPKSPEALLEQLSAESAYVCKEVAKNPHTSAQTLIKLAEQRPEVSLEVAQHPKLPGKQLALLSLSQNGSTREQVAKHPNTTPDRLRALLFDLLPLVRAAAAKNPNTPKEQVELLRQLTTPGALSALQIEELSNHKDSWIRAMVARHPNLSAEVVKRLSARDYEPMTELLQNTTIAAQVDQLLREEVSFATFAASSRSHPPDRMVLARHAATSVRLALAKNPRLNAELLAELLQDTDEGVRRAAEQNEQSRDLKLLLSHKE